MNVSGLFAIGDHLRRLSETGDPLEALGRIIDFEAFRPVLDAGLGYSDGSKGGRPPYDPVTMFKVLILAAQNNVSDERMEFLIRDRLSWLRFLGFDIGDRTPDENDPLVPRAAHALGHDRRALHRVRSPAPGQRLSRHGRADRRRQSGGCATPAQHGDREGAALPPETWTIRG